MRAQVKSDPDEVASLVELLEDDGVLIRGRSVVSNWR